MKKILFVLVALLCAAPALAAVDITAAVDPVDNCAVIISFDATSEPNLVRAFSLDIQADNDANIASVTLLSADYIIHPGSIVIDTAGTVQDYGSPVAPQSDLPSDTLPGLDSNGVTIEMASLYAPVGPGSPNAPDPSGDLIAVAVDKACTLTITANVSRAGSTGVVMESPDEVVTVNLPAPLVVPCVTECLKDTDPGYNTWVALGKGDCWCYRHQCQGDADGLQAFLRYVNLNDLNILKAEFGKTIADLQALGSNGCADFDHIVTFGRPVALSDLNILKANFGVAGLPDCDPTHINLPWLEP